MSQVTTERRVRERASVGATHKPVKTLARSAIRPPRNPEAPDEHAETTVVDSKG